jgi:hypothetical protein
MAKLTKALVREALEKNGGLKTQAALQLDVTPQALDYWLRKHPDLQDLRQVSLKKLTDIAEGHLFQAVVKGDMKWVQYFLDHHARALGYGAKLQLTGKDDAPLFDPAAMADFLSGLTDEQRAAFDTLRAANAGPDGVASLEPRSLQ